MVQKKSLNLAVPEKLLEQFNEACATYGHGKQKGMVLAAAVKMFLDAPPTEQGKFLEKVMAADIQEGVKRMMSHTEAQKSLEDATRNALQRAADNTPHPRLAAKKKGKSKRGFK